MERQVSRTTLWRRRKRASEVHVVVFVNGRAVEPGLRFRPSRGRRRSDGGKRHLAFVGAVLTLLSRFGHVPPGWLQFPGSSWPEIVGGCIPAGVRRDDMVWFPTLPAIGAALRGCRFSPGLLAVAGWDLSGTVGTVARKNQLGTFRRQAADLAGLRGALPAVRSGAASWRPGPVGPTHESETDLVRFYRRGSRGRRPLPIWRALPEFGRRMVAYFRGRANYALCRRRANYILCWRFLVALVKKQGVAFHKGAEPCPDQPAAGSLGAEVQDMFSDLEERGREFACTQTGAAAVAGFAISRRSSSG